jgi:hypothetical protein
MKEKKSGGIGKNKKLAFIFFMGIFLAILLAIFIFVLADSNNVNMLPAGKVISAITEKAMNPMVKLVGLTIDETAEQAEEETAEEQTAETPAQEQIQQEEEQPAGDGVTRETTGQEGQIPETLEQPVEEATEETNETREIEEENETEIKNIAEANETIETNESEVQKNETIIVNETIETDLTETNLTVNLTEVTISLNETNLTIVNETELNITELNMTEVNITLNETPKIILNITTIQYKAVVGKPVKWLKTIVVNKTLAQEQAIDLIVELPKQAENITVKTGEEAKAARNEAKQSEKELEKQERKSLITGEVVTEDTGKGILTKLWEFFIGFTITGKVVEEGELESQITQKEDKKELNIEEIVQKEKEEVQEIAIEYETPPPQAEEETISRGKRVTVNAEDVLNYTDILAYTQLDNKVSINESYKIKIYWVKEETKQEAIEEKTNRTEEINFSAYDLDKDGMVDYVEWNVPHLSNQTFEIIYITKAEHLDENYTFIEDVYEQVKEKDDIWKSIQDGHYLRVTFELPLDKTKDITIWARDPRISNNSIDINGTSVPLEIYEKKKRIDEIRRVLENE